VSELADAPKKTTVTVRVDGREIEAEPGELVIAAAQRHGTYIPRFCYHERMEPVGMCRMCLVDIDTGRGPALSVSCMVAVGEGMVVTTDSDRVKKAQEGVLEFLLANHPLDCPVCEKGGECPLQDQAVSHGPGESRFVEEKRHYEKPIPISDLVFLDRERCILCDRCTRFAKDVAGDPLIHFTHRGNNTQVMTFPDQPFASYFSGNTVQICPVGALTAKPYRFKARPWDLDQTESTCTTCSVGCRITVQSSRNELLRYQGVDSDAVNWGWLCDKGRFSFEAVNSADRLRQPALRSGDELVETSWSAAIAEFARLVTAALDAAGPSSIAMLGGARGTNEDAYAWAKLAKAVIGTDNVDAQLGDGLPAEVVFALPGATIDDAASAATVVLLGPDLKDELPVLYLRLRDAAEHRRVRLVELSAHDTGLTPYAWKSFRCRPGEQAAATRALLGNGDRNILGASDTDIADVRDQLTKGQVVVVTGRSSLAESVDFTVDALAALRAALPEARFLPVLRRGNVRGAIELGLTPGYVPGRTRSADAGDALTAAWGAVPAGPGLDARGILEAAASGRLGLLVLLGADPLSDFPDRDLARRALAGTTVVAVDTFVTASSALAAVVLPAAAFGEKAGTTTNLEGRVSVLSEKVTSTGTTRPDWIIATDLAFALGHDLGVESLVDVRAEIAAVSALHAELTEVNLKAERDGILLPLPDGSSTFEAAHADAAPANAYDFRLVVARKLYDAGVGVAQSPSLAPLAPGAKLHLHPLDVDRLGVAPGTSVKVSSTRASVTLEAHPDVAVPRGVAFVPFNQPNTAAGELLDTAAAVTNLRVETL
jgi:NADH-quinone oxidoreductase subunit G